MKKTLLFILFIISIKIQAQTYLDSDFNELNDSVNARYYRLIDSVDNRIVQKTFFINDSIYEILQYSKSKFQIRNGKCLQYYPNGKLRYEMNYSDNKIDGELRGYYENGNIKRIDHYNYESLIDGRCYTESGEDTTYLIYQKHASYQGGDLTKFQTYVSSKIKYPPLAVKKGIQGKVIVAFSVNAKGEVVNVNILQSPHELLSAEILRVVKESEVWDPPLLEGKKVKERFFFPIIFNLGN